MLSVELPRPSDVRPRQGLSKRCGKFVRSGKHRFRSLPCMCAWLGALGCCAIGPGRRCGTTCGAVSGAFLKVEIIACQERGLSV